MTFKKKTRDEAKEEVTALLSRKKSPIHIGEAALAIGPLWTLAETELFLDNLVQQGVLKKVEGPRPKYDLADPRVV